MLAKKLQAALAGAAAGGAYIEDVFSTYLFTGINAPLTITNGIDLATEGGMVWIKSRSYTNDHYITDTTKTTGYYLESNTTDAVADPGSGIGITGYNVDGFDFGNSIKNLNTSGGLSTSWTFRKAPKFFDVVTYTGDGTSPRSIAHNLGSVPGCVMVKRTDSTGYWAVGHRGVTSDTYLYALNSNAAGTTTTNTAGVTANGYVYLPNSNSTTFSVRTGSTDIAAVNASGGTYVAYLFAHDAGGFGDSGEENVISCGSFTKSSGVVYSETLGWEPQWLLFKRTDASENWFMIDNMRGMTVGGTDAYLIPNLTNAEGNLDFVTPTPTGFEATNNFNNGTYIYIAIRRGPMKTPTDGTEVFAPVAYAGDSSATRLVDAGINIDANISAKRSGPDFFVQSRLTGVAYLRTRSTGSETSSAGTNGIPTILTSENNKFGFIAGASTLSNVNETGSNYVNWAFRRAPGFFDVVCYSSDGNSSQVINHNLGVTPELIITKRRDGAYDWVVSDPTDDTKVLFLNLTTASTSYTGLDTFTSTTFTAHGVVNSDKQIAYLFASCPGVSKVGSYTGTGTTKQVNCGFSAGARFVLIKRTDSTGDWYVWDSARGIVAGNDPYLLLNSTAAEVTSTDYIDPYSAGFEISSSAPADINASGGSFIYLAIA